MHLLRCLIFVEAQVGCHLHEQYIDTSRGRFVTESCVFLFVKGAVGRSSSRTDINAPTRAPPQPPSRLGVTAMAPAVLHYFQEGLAASTRRTYGAAMKNFNAYMRSTPPSLSQNISSAHFLHTLRSKVWHLRLSRATWQRFATPSFP